MNSGRIKIENYHGILCCDMHMNDEFSLSDLAIIQKEIHKNYSSCTDVIWSSSGSYSISIEVQKAAMQGIKEFRNIVYVVVENTKKSSAEYAATTFMKSYNVRIANSKEEARAILENTSMKMPSGDTIQQIA